jgi:glycosyltransferase involved in cell wall biosynthesis
MKVLFLHPNMPGQFKHLVKALVASKENEVVFITQPNAAHIEGVKKVEYRVGRSSHPEIHRYILSLEKGVFQGQEVWRVAKDLKEKGFKPDLIVGHPGWGDGLFLKDLFPNVPHLFYCEFYYRAEGSDSNFFPDEPMGDDDRARIRIKNAINLFNLEACDWGVSPTFFQARQHPDIFRSKMSVLHDGVDTKLIRPLEKRDLKLPNGKVLKKGVPVVTYVTRNIEPYRGFPTFIKAMEKVLRERKDVQVLVIGGEEKGYGRAAPQGKTWRGIFEEGLDLDQDRLHYLGKVPYVKYLEILNFSTVHLYLTVPFVLSWSLMEAMAMGCRLVVSDTEPVQEVLRNEDTALMEDFFDHESFANRTLEVLSDPEAFDSMGEKCRQRIQNHYSLETLLPLHLRLMEEMAGGMKVPSVVSDIARKGKDVQNEMGLSLEGKAN